MSVSVNISVMVVKPGDRIATSSLQALKDGAPVKRDPDSDVTPTYPDTRPRVLSSRC